MVMKPSQMTIIWWVQMEFESSFEYAERLKIFHVNKIIFIFPMKPKHKWANLILIGGVMSDRPSFNSVQWIYLMLAKGAISSAANDQSNRLDIIEWLKLSFQFSYIGFHETKKCDTKKCRQPQMTIKML